MKTVMLLLASMASPDFTSAMRPGFHLPPGPSVESSSGYVESYDFPSGSVIYLRVTDEITLFGNLRVPQFIRSERENFTYGRASVGGDATSTIGGRPVRVGFYLAKLDACDDHHRSEYEICNNIRDQLSFLVYIERPGLPPLKSRLAALYRRVPTSWTVSYIGPIGVWIARGALQQVAENEPVWMPRQVCRNEAGQERQLSTPHQLPAPRGSTTAEMNFQPNTHILLRGSEPGFRFENGQFCRGQDDTLVSTSPKDGDIVIQNGAPIGRFRDPDEKWYPLNLTPRK